MYYFTHLSHIVDGFILPAGMRVWVVCTHTRTRLPDGYVMLLIFVPAGRNIIPYPSRWVLRFRVSIAIPTCSLHHDGVFSLLPHAPFFFLYYFILCLFLFFIYFCFSFLLYFFSFSFLFISCSFSFVSSSYYYFLFLFILLSFYFYFLLSVYLFILFASHDLL
jgi:hypothetical protein